MMNLLAGASVAAIVAFFGGLYVGDKMCEGSHAKADLKAEVHDVQVVKTQGQINTAAAAQQQAAQDHIVYVTRTITKEIPTYVTPQMDRSFPLSSGFVRLHDAAALGIDVSAVPLSAGQPDDAPSAVTESALGAVIVGNYGECLRDQSRLVALQDWIQQQQTAFGK